MTRRLTPFALLALVAVSCGGSSGGGESVLTPSETTVTTIDRGESFAGTTPAPEFPDGLEWLNVERPLSLAELRGKLVLLDFWTYGCINCIHIIPDLKRLEAEYADELVVIGVHSAKFANEGDTENIRDIIRRYGLEHPVVNDSDFAVWRDWGASAWPTVVLIDPAGNIVGGHAGEGIYPIFQPVIDSLVEEFDERGQIDRTPIDLDVERAPDTVLSFPGKVLADPVGGRLFVADTNHHRIVVADLETGEVIDVAGSGGRGLEGGDFATSSFDQPQGMALVDDGRTLLVADVGNHSIRALDLASRSVTTLVGNGDQSSTYPPRSGIAPDVELSSPWDLLVDGEVLYIAMAGSHQLWTLDLGSARFDPFAGTGGESVLNGPRLFAELAQPSGLAIDDAGRIYFADSESSSIRWADPGADGEVGLLAGTPNNLFDFGLVDGVGPAARFQHPLGVVHVDGLLFVADTYNSALRVIDLANGAVTTLAGGDQGWADGLDPRFSEPGGISFANGSLYVADTNNHVIRRVDAATGETETLVFYGIERFPYTGSDGGPATFEVAAVAAGPGAGHVVLDLMLPAGYKLNDIAPLTIAWSVEGDAADFGDHALVSIVEPGLPLEIPVTWSTGEATLRGELTVYYCTEESSELCLVHQVALEVPVVVASGGPEAVLVAYRIPDPD
ncbi:MAG: thioredoxin-like domain-containing protein [Acidimicrobiia bacterium]